jgi:hypothetical protein
VRSRARWGVFRRPGLGEAQTFDVSIDFWRFCVCVCYFCGFGGSSGQCDGDGGEAYEKGSKKEPHRLRGSVIGLKGIVDA